MKDFLFFFTVQFISYGVFCWNTRAVANAWYANIVVSDLIFAWLGFTVMEKIAASQKSKLANAGYVMGGALGSLLSVVITKHLIG